MSEREILNRMSVLPAHPAAGIGIHFSSLPGPLGIGDIGDSSRDFLLNLAAMKIRYWQFLPTGPTAYGDSPYQPLSAFAGNEMLIGVEPLVRAGALTAAEASVLNPLPAGHVDFGRLIPLKHALLAKAAGRFNAIADSSVKADYDDFQQRTLDPWLADYTLYRIIKTLHDERPWPEWAPEYVHREPAALERARSRYAEQIEHLKIIQFLFDRQWRMLRQRARQHNVSLFGDMPIYIALDSADAWANPGMLQIDRDGAPSHVAGVPPDYFSEDGQLWGNPLYDWEHHGRTGYQWWIKRMRHAERMFDLVRIDHFRGFESYWSIPASEKTARKGRWEPGPGDALFDAMKSAMGRLPIIAEDLGVITDEVEALRLRHHIPGMRVLQFEVDDPDFDPADIEEQTVCYTGTHDNDTTVGWFRGESDQHRTPGEIEKTQKNALRFTNGSSGSIHEDMIRLAFASRARIAIAPMQDFLGLCSEARLNVPGTTLNNWRWRLQADQIDSHLRTRVSEMVNSSLRA